MPTVRYQIRNEYGLGNSELYRTADKDDPEAILEGVAMVGLVGLLKQLGDLAEFAAERFHNLHEELINTASRGHKLVLRVQQLETELPSIGKGLFSKTDSSHLSYEEGIDWQCNLQMDHNVITAGEMPQFVMDTYKECRGPPQLFKLDKFDIAGAGACLKRYTDPSFFRMESAFSRLVEEDAQREKRACKIKKKVSFSCGGESPESLLMPHINSRLQPATSDQVFNKVTLKHVKLKPVQLNESVIHSLRSYMENCIDLDPIEEQAITETSVSQSIMMKSTEPSKSATEVHEIIADVSSNREKNRDPSPTKQETTTAVDSERQEIERKGFSDMQLESASEVGQVHPIYSKLEEKATDSKNTSNTNGHSYSSQLNEVKSNLSASQEVDQNGFLSDAECRSENSSDVYISDEISSELENYMDALTDMESEIETDAENQGKPDSVFVSIKSQETDSDTNEELEDLQTQYSEQYFIENSTSSPGFTTVFRKGAANPSFSDTLGHLAAQLLEENKNDSGFPSISDLSLGETDGISFPQTNDELTTCESAEHLLLSGTCNVEASDIPTSSVCGEAFCSFSTTDSTSTVALVTVGMNETSYEGEIEQGVSYLDGELPCKRGTSELPSEEKSSMIHEEFAKNCGLPDSLYHMSDQKLLVKDDVPKEFEYAIKEQSTHDMVRTTNRTVLHSQKQNGAALERVPTELGNVLTSNDGLASSRSVLTLENSDSFTEEEAQISGISPYKEEILCCTNESQRPCTGGKEYPDNVHFPSEKVKNDVTQVSMHVADQMVLPHKSTTTSETLKDVEPIEAYNDVHSFSVEFKQKMVADGAFPGKIICKISDRYCSENVTQLDYTSSTYMCASSEEQALSSSSLIPVELLDAERSSALKYLQKPSPENSKEMVPDIILTMAVEVLEEALIKESSSEPECVYYPQDAEHLTPSVLHFIEDSSAKQRSTGIHPSDLVDKKILVDSSERKYLFDSKASIFYPFKSSDEHMKLAEASCLSEDASESEVGGEPNLISPQQNGKHIETRRRASAESEFLDETCTLQEPGLHIITTSDVDFSESKMQPPKETISGQLSCGGSIPFQCNSDLLDNASISFSTSPASPMLSNKERIYDTSSQQSSEQQPELASGSPDNVTPEDITEIPQISQIPPIPWRLAKPLLGSLVSTRSVAQPPSGSNLAISLPTIEKEPSQELLAAGAEIEESNCIVQSQKSCEVPTVVMESYEHNTLHSDRRMMGPSLESLFQVDKRVYDHTAFGEGNMNPTEQPSTVQNKSFLHISASPSDEAQSTTMLESEVIPSLDERPRDGELRSHENDAANLDRQSPTPLLVASVMTDEKHKSNHEVPDSAVNTNLPPLPVTRPKNSRHESLSAEEKSSSSLHDLTTTLTPEDDKPIRKLYSVMNRPNGALIEAIASHDKSKLRKAHELIRTSAMPKSDEKGSFLEQIRNKSVSLKPTAAPAMRFKGGPPTNLKVIAILEKANAIRQACAGSDDDNSDGDSWSDS